MITRRTILEQESVAFGLTAKNAVHCIRQAQLLVPQFAVDKPLDVAHAKEFRATVKQLFQAIIENPELTDEMSVMLDKIEHKIIFKN